MAKYFGGGGGSSPATPIHPLSNAFYVDGGSSGATPDGSIANPFKTLTSGLGAIALLATAQGTLIVTEGSYVAEGATALPNKIVSIRGLGLGRKVLLPPLTTAFQKSVSIEDCALATFSDSSAGMLLSLSNCSSGALAGKVGGVSSLTAKDSDIAGDMTDMSSVEMFGGSYTGNAQAVSLQMTDCVWSGNVSGDGSGFVTAVDSSISSMVESNMHGPSGGSPGSTARGCVFGPNVVLHDTWSFDAQSLQTFFMSDGSLDGDANNSLDCGEMQCAQAPDGDLVTDFTGITRLVLGAHGLSGAHNLDIATTGALLGQLFIVDSYGNNGQTLTVRSTLGPTTLFTFTNNSGAMRACFRVTDVAGNGLVLHSAERLLF